jgi:hypothetical protein
MQKILFFLRRLIAKAVPAVIAAGSAGGTVIVIRLRHLSTMSEVSQPWSSISLKVAAKPIKAMIPIPKTNFKESS